MNRLQPRSNVSGGREKFGESQRRTRYVRFCPKPFSADVGLARQRPLWDYRFLALTRFCRGKNRGLAPKTANCVRRPQIIVAVQVTAVR